MGSKRNDDCQKFFLIVILAMIEKDWIGKRPELGLAFYTLYLHKDSSINVINKND